MTDLKPSLSLCNQLTILRALASLVFIPIVMMDDQLARLLALLIFTLAAFSDYYDGRMARLLNAKSDFGVIADPIADKMLTGICLVAQSLIRPELVPLWMTLIILVRETAITSFRLHALRTGRVLGADRWGKWKTGLQMTVIPYALLVTALLSGDRGRVWAKRLAASGWDAWVFGFGWWLALLTTLLTVYSGAQYWWKNRRA